MSVGKSEKPKSKVYIVSSYDLFRYLRFRTMKDSLANVPLFSDFSESDTEESSGANPTIAK